MTTEHNNIIRGNALEVLRGMPDASVHLIVTDPPYFIDGMGSEWNHNNLAAKAKKAGVVGSLPVGMKFDREQGYALQRFLEPIAVEMFRVLKPGGFCVVFSQARLYGRIACAVEDAGFEMRDMLGWCYEGQAKAFSQDHFVRRKVESGELSLSQAKDILSKLGGRKTPQLKPQIEPMTLAQKPRDGTFIDNWLAHETGLIDTTQSLDGKFPGNIMWVDKPKQDEKGVRNTHMTVKPLTLIRHLIRLLSTPGQTVLDPFAGSGTHVVAAKMEKRIGLGIELDRQMCQIAQERVDAVQI